MYKQFFAGELEVLCSMPEFWRKVTVIYSGGDDFAVYGAWDALIGLAREIERLFHRFAETQSQRFRRAGRQDHQHGAGVGARPSMLRWARCLKKPGSVWKPRNPPTRIASGCWAARSNGSSSPKPPDLKDSLMRMIADFGCSPQYLHDLCGIYRETQSKMSRRQARRTGGERPWRYHRRIRRILGAARPRRTRARRVSESAHRR